MKTIAIIGASKDRRKFGNKAVRAFEQGGWRVFPVNRHEDTIEGHNTYARLRDIPERIDRVSMYVPPEVGVTLLPEIADCDPEEVFFSPGSESPEVLEKARQLGIEPIVACSVVNIGLRPEMFPDE